MRAVKIAVKYALLFPKLSAHGSFTKKKQMSSYLSPSFHATGTVASDF